MASFDIVSKVDLQSFDNAINSVNREISTRYDFKGSNSSVEFDKKEYILHLITENEMKLEAIEDIIRSKVIKQNINPSCLDFGKEKYAAGNNIKKDIKVKEGIDKETAKKIVKEIKTLNLKVQAQIMDDQVRVNGKKLDELQAVIAMCKSKDFDTPLQYINMK